MRSRHWSAGVFSGVALALFCVAPSARGGFTTYTTPAAYNAASTGNMTHTFSGVAPANGFIQEPVPPGLTLGGVNFTIDTSKSNGRLFVVDMGFSNNFFHATTLDSQFSTSTNENILITLPNPVTAAAFDFGSINSTTVTFALSTGDSFTSQTPGSHGIQFIGVTSSAPFTSVELSQPIGDALNLVDFTSGTATPEPASLTLLATGGLGLLGYGIRRRRIGARL
jgi:hypothetical protein